MLILKHLNGSVCVPWYYLGTYLSLSLDVFTVLFSGVLQHQSPDENLSNTTTEQM